MGMIDDDDGCWWLGLATGDEGESGGVLEADGKVTGSREATVRRGAVLWEGGEPKSEGGV